MKLCTKCKIEKEDEEFSLRSLANMKRKTICRACHSEYRKLKYIENREKERKQVEEYRKNNPSKYSKELKAFQRQNPSRKSISVEECVDIKHCSYSKKAGRTIEDKCPKCEHIVYKSKTEISKRVVKYCSSECRRTSFKDEYYHYHYDVKRRCKGDCINNVTIEYLKWLLEEKQNFKCNVTGIPIRLYKSNEKNVLYNSASLDRIDSSKGYIEGNVQWVCLGVNYMKMNFSNDELLETIRLIKAVV